MGATYSGLSSLLRRGVSKMPKGFRASEFQAKKWCSRTPTKKRLDLNHFRSPFDQKIISILSGLQVEKVFQLQAP